MRNLYKINVILVVLCFTVTAGMAAAGMHSIHDINEEPLYRVDNGNVVFKAMDLPGNYNFSVTIDSKTYFSTFSTMNLSLPYGNYSYSINLPFKYVANRTSGTFEITGKVTEITFIVHARGSDTIELLGTSILVSVIAILLVLLVYTRYMKVEK